MFHNPAVKVNINPTEVRTSGIQDWITWANWSVEPNAPENMILKTLMGDVLVAKIITEVITRDNITAISKETIRLVSKNTTILFKPEGFGTDFTGMIYSSFSTQFQPFPPMS
jgi:hypothetical protein